MAQQGILLISDITGYTTYLHDSELEHAQESLADLLKLLIEQTRLPLVIAKIEGDAVFSYAPAEGFVHGQTLMEMIEITYASFRKALDLMVLNTTCTCRACRNLPNLDLKFFVHFGQYSIQDLGSFRELAGTDVNLIHRLVKNGITEATGFKAYAVYTQQLIDALEMATLIEGLASQTETYADVGDVHVRVADMHEVWQRRAEEVRIEVKESEAIASFTLDFPVPPSILWDYVTRPEHRVVLFDSTEQQVSAAESGRIGGGSVYVCYHGTIIAKHTVLDWKPFETYTTNETWPFPGVTGTVTYRIVEIDEGSRLGVYCAPLKGPWLYRTLATVFAKLVVFRKIQDQADVLYDFVTAQMIKNDSAIDHTYHNL
jgi:hypothetical protein